MLGCMSSVVKCINFYKQLIDTEINPYVNEWEAKEQMPSHHIWKLMGDAGFLGVHKPVGNKFTN